MTDVLQVSTTTDTRDAAVELASSAVQARLAASAQVYGPVASVFWHEGTYDAGEEWQVLLKTTAGRYPDLERHLVEHHPWSNPEVTAIPISVGSAPYLEWVRRATADPA